MEESRGWEESKSKDEEDVNRVREVSSGDGVKHDRVQEADSDMHGTGRPSYIIARE